MSNEDIHMYFSLDTYFVFVFQWMNSRYLSLDSYRISLAQV